VISTEQLAAGFGTILIGVGVAQILAPDRIRRWYRVFWPDSWGSWNAPWYRLLGVIDVCVGVYLIGHGPR